MGEKLKGNFTSSKYHHFLVLIYILPLEIILPHLERIWIYATSVLDLPTVNLPDFWGLKINMTISFIFRVVMLCGYFLLYTVLSFPEYTWQEESARKELFDHKEKKNTTCFTGNR